MAKIEGFGQVLETIAILLQSELKKAAPADTGRLRQSIKVRVASDNTLEVFMTDYWKHVEFGTNPHIISPKNKKALSFKTSGGKIITKKVEHPGTRPNPFIRKTLNIELPKIIEQIIK